MTYAKDNNVLVYFGPLTCCVYLSLFITRKYHYYSCTIQHSRYDLKLKEEDDVFHDLTEQEDSDLQGFAIELMGGNEKKKSKVPISSGNLQLKLISSEEKK